MTERILGPTGSRRRKRTWLIPAVVVLAATVAFGVTSAIGASLPGSNFEIDNDANLTVQGAGALDWGNVNELRRQDTASGNSDESFGQGAKEDTAVPAVVDGGIPPNKSDLKFFGVYQEGTSSAGFLNMFWSRVQDPSGTTNMDFEFNKLACTPAQTPADPDCTANGLTPTRSLNDILVTYDLSNGGTVPSLSIRKWTASGEWGAPTTLSSSTEAAGSINSSTILAANSDGLGQQDPRTFGEAQIAMTAIFPPGSGCSSFGSAYLKSRSSDSFTAALKDFVPPVAVNITNCGSISIHKQDDVGTALANVLFTLYTDNAPLGGAAPHGAEDVATSITCTTDASGDCTMSNVPFGRYWVVEGSPPAGHTAAADQNVTLSSGTATVSLTFVNQRQPASVKVKKVDDDSPANNLSGATFTLFTDAAPVGGTRGAEDTTTGLTCGPTPANGECTISNILTPGNYWVVETVTPAGYDTAADRSISLSAGQNLDLTGAPFVNPRKFSVIVIVCRNGGSGNSLYPSAVTIDGDAAPGNSISSAQATSAGLTDAQLCGITQARKTGLHHGTHNANPITIPQ